MHPSLLLIGTFQACTATECTGTADSGPRKGQPSKTVVGWGPGRDVRVLVSVLRASLDVSEAGVIPPSFQGSPAAEVGTEGSCSVTNRPTSYLVALLRAQLPLSRVVSHPASMSSSEAARKTQGVGFNTLGVPAVSVRATVLGDTPCPSETRK